jgi:hypothetical protein
MANKFARSNGDFNNASIWSGLAASMSATSVPTIGDNAIANTFTIQITGNVACNNITNGTTYGGTNGGVFNLNDNSSLSASNVAEVGTHCLLLSGTNSSLVYGNIVGGAGAGSNGILKSGTGNLVIYGQLTGGSRSGSGGQNGHGISITGSSGNVTVYGNLNGSSANAIATGLSNTSTGSVTVYGNLNGATASALSNTSTGPVTVIGNLNGSTAAGLSNTSTGSVTVLGNVIGNSRGGSGIASTNAAANVRISGNLIGAPNGIPAVYAAAYTVNPVPYQTYIRYANNGTGVGSDAYLYHYTTDSLSAFSMPPVSAVRAGVQYADNTLTGTCQIPSVSSVAFGALVDNTTGTATLTSTLWETPISSLTATNSVGARLKNSATVESVGRIIASFSNG